MVKSHWTFKEHQCQLQHGVPWAHLYIYLWKESDVASFPIPYFFDGHDHQKKSLRIRIIYTFLVRIIFKQNQNQFTWTLY